MSYENYYGLKEQAFSNAPDSRFYYESSQHAEAMVRMLNDIDHGDQYALPELVGGEDIDVIVESNKSGDALAHHIGREAEADHRDQGKEGEGDDPEHSALQSTFDEFDDRESAPTRSHFVELRPASPARNIANCDRDGFLLANENDKALAARDAGVEEISLQHCVPLRSAAVHRISDNLTLRGRRDPSPTRWWRSTAAGSRPSTPATDHSRAARLSAALSRYGKKRRVAPVVDGVVGVETLR